MYTYAQNHYIYIYIYMSCTVAHHYFPSNGAARRPPGRAIARLRATQLRFQRQNQPGIPGALVLTCFSHVCPLH
jgi:hypothetical protein